MRQAYIVTYDIANPKRLRKVFEMMKGYGEWLQLSVFRCELNAKERIQLRSNLAEIINHHEDQVLFVDFGPVDGRAESAIEAVGKAYLAPERRAVVV